MILNDSIDRYNRSRDKISRGAYPIPFEFVLPSSLPASTQFPKLQSKAFNGRIKVRSFFFELQDDFPFEIIWKG